MLGKHKLYVINPRHITAEDTPLVGDEGIEIAQLAKQGIPVPDSFVLTSVAFDDFVTAAGIVDRVAALLAKLSLDRPNEILQISTEIKQLITNANFPNTIIQPISHSYRSLSGLTDKYVEVCPSWTLDGLLIPPAYHQPVEVDIRGEASLLYAIKLAWASMFNPDVISHRLSQGYTGELTMAVIVRRSIQAEISGVAYNFDPYTGNDSQFTIEAVLGVSAPALKEQLEKAADLYKIDAHDLRILEKNIVPQEKMYIRKGRSSGEKNPLIEVAISTDWQRRQKLEDGYISLLTNLIKQISIDASGQVMISWAIELGKVFVSDIQELTPQDQPSTSPLAESIVADSLVDQAVKAIGTVTPPTAESTRKAQRVNIKILANEVENMVASGTSSLPPQMEDIAEPADTLNDVTAQPDLDSPVELKQIYGLVTGVYLDVSRLDNELLTKAKQFDGAYLDANQLLVEHKTLPEEALGDQQKLSKLVDHLAMDISTVAKAVDPKPVLYKFSSLDAELAKRISPSAKNFPESDGCRRFIEDPRLMFVEILALKKAMNIYGVRSISTILPNPRTEEEIVQVRKILSGQNLYRGSQNSLIAEIATPAFAYQFDRMDAQLTNGVFIDIDEFALSMLGIKALRQTDTAVIYPQLENIVTAAKSSSHLIAIKLSHQDHKSISLFSQLGVSMLIFDNTPASTVLEEIHQINQQKLSRKGKPGRRPKRLI